MQKVQNLLDIVTWTRISTVTEGGEEIVSNAYEFIELILKSFTLTPLSVLSPFAATRKSGTIQHHVRSPSFRESIVPNVLSNLYTRITGESNSHLRLRHSKQHFLVNFLHIYCYAVWVIFLELEFSSASSTPTPVWVITNECEFCDTPITESPLVFNLDLCRGLSLHPLATSRLGEVAQEVLQESLNLVSGRVYNRQSLSGDPIHRSVAITGVLQEVMNYTYFHKKSLQERYTGHALNQEGYNVIANLALKNTTRSVGQTELKRIPLDDLIEFLTSTITFYADYCKSTSGYKSTQEYLSTVPGDQLPWYGLVDAIHSIGKLPLVIARMAKQTTSPHPVCYYNPITAAKYLGRMTNVYAMNLALPQRLVILSYYTTEHMFDPLYRVFSNAIKHNVASRYYKMMIKIRRTDIEQDVDDTQYINSLVRWIKELALLATVHNQLAELVPTYGEHILQHGSESIPTIPIHDVTLDDFLMFVSDAWEKEVTLIQGCVNQYKSLGLELPDLDDTDEEEFEQIKGSLMQYIDMRDVSVQHTSLSDCIMTVRGLASYESDPDINHTLETVIDIPPNPEVVRRPSLPNFGLVVSGTPYILPLQGIEPTHGTIYSPSSFIPLNNAFRIKGTSNGSEYTLLNILVTAGCNKQQHDETLAVLCLADGFGGFSSAIRMIYPSSPIVYHTVPLDPNLETVPVTYEAYDLAGTIITKHLDEGHWTLHDNRLFQRVETYNLRYHTITSDLEIQPAAYHQYKDIHANILRFYISNSGKNTVIILKLNGIMVDVNLKILDVLRHICKYVGFTQPFMVNDTSYYYIYACGLQKFTLDVLDEVWAFPPSHNSITVLTRFVRRLKAKDDDREARLGRGFNLLTVDTTFASHTLLTDCGLEDRFTSLLQNNLDATVLMNGGGETSGFVSWRHVRLNIHRAKSGPEFFAQLKYDPWKIMNQLSAELNTGKKRYRPGYMERDDAAHRDHILNKIAYLQGLLYIMSRYQGLLREWKISTLGAYESFVAWYQTLANRDRRGNVPLIHRFDDPWIYDGKEIRMMSYYRQGISCGLSIAGLMACLSQNDNVKESLTT